MTKVKEAKFMKLEKDENAMNPEEEKEQSLVPNQQNPVPDPQLSKRGAEALKVVEETNARIKEGLEKETASTGTPMNSLSGAAYFTAQLSNVGGGSLEIGGGGMQEGLATIRENDRARGMLIAEIQNGELVKGLEPGEESEEDPEKESEE